MKSWKVEKEDFDVCIKLSKHELEILLKVANWSAKVATFIEQQEWIVDDPFEHITKVEVRDLLSDLYHQNTDFIRRQS